jgi:glycopeptide antibiotics resistance protein
MISDWVTALYYILVAYVVVFMIYNFARAKSWEREVLYVVVLIPFLLRLLRLK